MPSVKTLMRLSLFNFRFGKPVIPREWFLVPLFVIDEVVERIKGGTVSQYVYDTAASLKLV